MLRDVLGITNVDEIRELEVFLYDHASFDYNIAERIATNILYEGEEY